MGPHRPVALIGAGCAGAGDDPVPFLADPKEAKYLGLADRLAVVAASRAAAGLSLPRERTGLFLAVGHLPFDPADIEGVLRASLDPDGSFSLRRFTASGWTRARPLLAFRCLPNLGAYHVSAAVRISGPCTVTYPGPGQLHGALEDAVDALWERRIDAALVGGVAAQRNWLTEHHHERLDPPVPPEALLDAAAFLVLVRDGEAERPLAHLVGAEADYRPFERVGASGWRETPGDGLRRGPAALPMAVAQAAATGTLPLRHEVLGPDGIRSATEWIRGGSACFLGGSAPQTPTAEERLPAAPSPPGAHAPRTTASWPGGDGSPARLGAARWGARRRVVVTAMGAVHPLGIGVGALVSGLLGGRSAVGPITRFDPSGLPTRIAAQVPDAERLVDPEHPDLRIAFALAAAEEVRRSWGSGPSGRGLVSMGVGLELFSMAELARQRAGLARTSLLETPTDHVVHLLSARFGAALPPRVHVTACAAGADAIGDGLRRIRAGRADWALCGGTDSMIHPLGVAGFCALQATSTRNDDPAAASRPFDRRRDGFVMGEGAAVLLLEEREAALARGAPILAEIAGYGSVLESWRISDPHPEGRGALAAMQAALDDAGLGADDLDAVNAHGTSTPANDVSEAAALRALLGDRPVPISAPKSMIGHAISAAGALEAVATIGCMREGQVHPTLNLAPDGIDDAARGLDHVLGRARVHPQRTALSCSYGFGGHCSALVLCAGA